MTEVTYKSERKDLMMTVRGRMEIRRERNEAGHPTGGGVEGPGISVQWQVGHVDPTVGQNGPIPVDVLNILIDRLEWYQEVNEDAWACEETDQALLKLREARMWMGERQRNRQARGRTSHE